MSTSLTDSQIWRIWVTRPEVLYGEDDSMEAQFIAAVRVAIKADRDACASAAYAAFINDVNRREV